VLGYQFAKKSLTQQVLDHLESVAAVQRARLESVTAQNIEKLKLISSRTQLRQSLAGYSLTANRDSLRRINTILSDALSSTASFRRLSVINLQGKVVASTDASAIGQNLVRDEVFTRGRTGNSADILRLDAQNQLYLMLCGPLFQELKPEKKVLGVLLIEADARQLLEPIRDYTGLGESGETQLARRGPQGEAIFLAPLRFDSQAALRHSVTRDGSTKAILIALEGNNRRKGVLYEATDYRGHHVLAATQYLPQTQWGLVVKIDHAEALRPLYQLRNLLLLVFVSAAGIVFVVAWRVSRTIVRPLGDLTSTAVSISAGDLSRRAQISDANDEIGMLALAFNRMTDDLAESRANLERKVEARTADLAAKSQQLQVANAQLEGEIAERQRTEEERDAFFTLSLDMLCIADFNGYFVRLNPSWEKVLGYSQQELMARPFIEFVHPDDHENTVAESIKLAQGGDVVSFENRYLCKNGTYRWLLWSCAADVKHGVILAAARDITRRKEMEQALQRATDDLQALSRKLVDVQETERRELSRELHDRIGQNLTALGINLDLIKARYSAGDREIVTRLDDSIALVTATADATVNLLTELRPPMLDDLGLLAALEWCAKGFSDRTGIDVAVTAEEGLPRLAPRSEIALFRIAQEALNNVAKHADARRVDIEVTREGSAWVMSVSDDGRGIPGRDVRQTTAGFGMATMRERALAAGGRFEVLPRPSGGTSVVVRMPAT
jgi:PAS domain S-box-containing protein